jgi:hypothetical protein
MRFTSLQNKKAAGLKAAFQQEFFLKKSLRTNF